MKKLLIKAGIPEEEHEGTLQNLDTFTSLLIMLMKANHIPNYLLFQSLGPDGMYELTIRKHEGKTPCDSLNEKDEEIRMLKQALDERCW